MLNFSMGTKKRLGGVTVATEVNRTITYNESRGGGNYSSRPPVSCGTVSQVHICTPVNSQGGSLPGLVLIYEMSVGIYISIDPKSEMVLRYN